MDVPRNAATTILEEGILAGKQQHDAGLDDGHSNADTFRYNAILGGLSAAHLRDLKTAQMVDLALRDPIYRWGSLKDP